MSNWNEEIDTPGRCTICKYNSALGCNCPGEFREAQCDIMRNKYYNCVDENGKRYRIICTGKEYEGDLS